MACCIVVPIAVSLLNLPLHSTAVQGVYYGTFPHDDRPRQGDPGSIWVVSRPHNWRPAKTQEALLRLALPSGQEIERASLPTRCALRRRGSCTYVALYDAPLHMQ